jgi:hypothetical protein|tara:strand:- start:251 stop:496 length:246 start_codon:yes stop_codon:yes gene_type:complete
MKNLMANLQKYLAVLTVISAVGGGFWTVASNVSTINNRLDNLEGSKQSIDLAPLETQIAILEEKVSKLEKAADNSRNPLAQ